MKDIPISVVQVIGPGTMFGLSPDHPSMEGFSRKQGSCYQCLGGHGSAPASGQATKMFILTDKMIHLSVL